MNKSVHEIGQRLSLREPQKDSLAILDDLISELDICSINNPTECLEKIKAKYQTVTDFEREFPSLCFALATGVGKTRLMGAFIAYLFREHDLRHFFVLAPNLTIYDKLIKDFTPNTLKYVFEGLGEFALKPPGVVTGENYEQTNVSMMELQYDCIINIFNVSKINSEVRGGKEARIHRLSECIGDSYFNYLSKLDDLVLLMDESHRYRASAGVNAINDLKPILGLELTATPKSVGTRGADFKNVIYSYPLSEAMKDGFVKEPTVATRENFNPKNYTGDQLERLKLEDGIRVHEYTKVQLETYAQESGEKLVKPFMLVVAQDTTHAEALKSQIDDDGFFGGRYKGKVITVHSNQSGELKDEALQSLLNVESPEEATEIVIHVNKLGEGWDVTNLYTIVPLRASASEILTEQTIGRGLRLPFGKRTGKPEIDSLTIIAHDKFQQIIDEAKNPNSIIKRGVVIGRDIPDAKPVTIVAPPRAVTSVLGGTIQRPGGVVERQEPLFSDKKEQTIARYTVEAIQKMEKLRSYVDLSKPEVQQQIVREVQARYQFVQPTLDGMADEPDVPAIVQKTAEKYTESCIHIPRITIVPSKENRFEFREFRLEPPKNHYTAVASDILQHALSTGQVRRIGGSDGVVVESVLENYLVKHLIDYDDVSYDENVELLIGLARQMLSWLRSYITDEEEQRNILQYHGRAMAGHIHTQMEQNMVELEPEFEGTASYGTIQLKEQFLTTVESEQVRDFRDTITNLNTIPSLVFDAFAKCTYDLQKFDSNPERLFAGVLEQENSGVIRWVKPAKGQFKIYLPNSGVYNPDFVVETKDVMYICEPKKASEIGTLDVEIKKKAAVKWCDLATQHAKSDKGKPWKYALIPHDAILPTSTFKTLMDAHVQD